MNTELVQYINKKILPVYEAFTDGHDRSHVEMVIRESVYLAEKYGADVDMAYTVAAYHDLGIPRGRKIHHLASAELMLEDKNLLKWFTDEQLNIMKEAVEDHRASAENGPRSIYGCIAADADHFIEPEDAVKRVIQYGIVNFPYMTHTEHIARARGHMYEKFCDGGYLHYYLNDKRSLDGLSALRSLVADEEKFAEICERYL